MVAPPPGFEPGSLRLGNVCTANRATGASLLQLFSIIKYGTLQVNTDAVLSQELPSENR
jgi:hypothetical protein